MLDCLRQGKVPWPSLSMSEPISNFQVRSPSNPLFQANIKSFDSVSPLRTFHINHYAWPEQIVDIYLCKKDKHLSSYGFIMYERTGDSVTYTSAPLISHSFFKSNILFLVVDRHWPTIDMPSTYPPTTYHFGNPLF